MSTDSAFDVLATLTEVLADAGRPVTHVEAAAGDGDGGLAVSLTTSLPLCDATSAAEGATLSPTDAELTADGQLRVEFGDLGLPALPEDVAARVHQRATGVTTEDGTLRLEMTVDIDPPQGEGAVVTAAEEAPEPVSQTGDAHTDDDTAPQDEAADAGTTDDPASDASESTSSTQPDPRTDEVTAALLAARNPDTPAYDDTEYLQALYDTCENFIEMSERIEMDVSSETVRRYMIEADIHEPASYQTDAAADDEADSTEQDGSESPAAESEEPTATPATGDQRAAIADEQLVTDGLGLPDGIRIEDVADAVVDAVTVYEVQTALDLDRQRTQDLLETLDLLDLVLRPLSGNPEAGVTYEQVASRIRECVPRRPDTATRT